MNLKILSLLLILIAILDGMASIVGWLALNGRPSGIPKRFGHEVFGSDEQSFRLVVEVGRWVAAGGDRLLTCSMVANVFLLVAGIIMMRLAIRSAP